MTSATANKTKVEANWNVEKVREISSHIVANQFMAGWTVISKYGDSALEEFGKEIAHRKASHYKSIGVKSPLDLVRAIAETESNVFGSKITFWGDEKSASMSYDSCAMWEAMQKSCGSSCASTEEKLGKHFAHQTEIFAKEFGFKPEMNFGENTCTISFHK